LDFCSRFDFKRPLSLSHFFAARKKVQLTGKSVHFSFTNVTRFELHVFCSIMKGLGRKVSGALKKITGGSSSRSRGGSSSYTPKPTPTLSMMDYKQEEQYGEMLAELQAEVTEIDAEDAPYLDL
jgi:hypothetical protein